MTFCKCVLGAAISAWLVLSSPSVFAGETVCEKELVAAPDLIDESSILGESHSLLELISGDPKSNLAYQHPAIIMDAGQRVISWILSKGESTIPNPGYGPGDVPYYPAFSQGVRGHRIIGQYDVVKTVVDYAKAAARGDGSAAKMVTLVGPPGTGKTEFLTILAYLAQDLTSVAPDYFNYTYEWHDLSAYPELYAFLNMQPDGKGGEIEHPLNAEMNDSPFVLLPKPYQDPLLKLARERVLKLSKEVPDPVRDPNPKCAFIRDTLLKAEMKKLNKKSLTPREQVEILSKHIRIKRLVIGAAGSMAKINAEGKDIDWSGLFLSPNAMMINTFGAGHPFSYFLNGKILRANGSFLLLDEFLRNEQSLRDSFLEVIENQQVTRGGAPVVHFNAFLLGASNSESLARVKADGQSRANVDRLRIVQMPYSLNPFEIAETMLLMKGPDNIYQQKLEDLSPDHLSVGLNGPEQGQVDGTTGPGVEATPIEQPVVPGNFSELFPLPLRGEPPHGPDHRYKLFVKSSSDENGQPLSVHLSPHTLLYMAQTVSGSRMNTSVADAEKFNPNYEVIKTSAFRSVVTRMMILMKKYDSIAPGQLQELEELSKYLEDGHFGISARDAANTWLQEAIAEAARPENGQCLTPQLARKVFFRLLSEKAIQYPDNKTRAKWITIANDMSSAFLVPAIQNDVHIAISSGVGTIRSIYEEVYEELLTLSQNEKATTYRAENGEDRPINAIRLEQIRQIYRETQGRDFDIREVLVFHARRRSSTSVMHKGLEETITRWLSGRSTDLVAYDDIERFSRTGEGNAEVRSKFSDVSHVMLHRLGYCPHCLRSAVALAKEEAAKKGPKKPEPSPEK